MNVTPTKRSFNYIYMTLANFQIKYEFCFWIVLSILLYLCFVLKSELNRFLRRYVSLSAAVDFQPIFYRFNHQLRVTHNIMKPNRGLIDLDVFNNDERVSDDVKIALLAICSCGAI